MELSERVTYMHMHFEDVFGFAQHVLHFDDHTDLARALAGMGARDRDLPYVIDPGDRCVPYGFLPPVFLADQITLGIVAPQFVDLTKELDDDKFLAALTYFTIAFNLRIVQWTKDIPFGTVPDKEIIEKLDAHAYGEAAKLTPTIEMLLDPDFRLG